MNNIITYGPSSLNSLKCVNVTHQPRRLIITIDKSYCFLCWRGVEGNLSKLDDHLSADLPDVKLERIFRTSIDQDKVNNHGSALICETCRLYFKFATHFKILCETACTLKKGVKANEDLVKTLRGVMNKTLDIICDKRKLARESENKLLVVLNGNNTNPDPGTPIVHLVNQANQYSNQDGGLPSIIRVPKTLTLTRSNIETNNFLETNGIENHNEYHETTTTSNEIMSDMLSQSAFEDFLSSTSPGDTTTDQTMQDVEKALTEICKNLHPRSFNEHRLDDVDNQLLEGYLSAFPLEDDENIIEKNLDGIVDHVVGCGDEIIEQESTEGLYINAFTGVMELPTLDSITEEEFSPEITSMLEKIPWPPIFDNDNDVTRDASAVETDSFKISYECHTCKRLFASEKDFSLHWCKNTRKEKQSICPYCGKLGGVYSIHPLFCKLKPDKPAPVDCPYEKCDLQFKHKKSLYNHILRVHNKAGPFICHDCGKKFTTKVKTMHHLQFVHLNQRKFECKQCSKRFHTQWHLE